jgi:hypothetical protein
MAPKKSRKLMQKIMVEKPTQDPKIPIEALRKEE